MNIKNDILPYLKGIKNRKFLKMEEMSSFYHMICYAKVLGVLDQIKPFWYNHCYGFDKVDFQNAIDVIKNTDIMNLGFSEKKIPTKWVDWTYKIAEEKKQRNINPQDFMKCITL